MPKEQTPEPAGRYLKNASVRKDADGDYWLFIEAGDLQAMFCLSHNEGNEDSIERRALAAWIAEQDSTNGKANALRTN